MVTLLLIQRTQQQEKAQERALVVMEPLLVKKMLA
jgi:hypothetical protein